MKHTWMPDPAEVASQSASGTAAVWVTSSSANRTGLGMRLNGVREPANMKSRWTFSTTARNSGAAGPAVSFVFGVPGTFGRDHAPASGSGAGTSGSGGGG